MPEISTSILSWATAGGTGGLVLFGMIKLLDFISGRMDKQGEVNVASAKRLDEATYKLIENLEKRLDALTERLGRVEGELIECRAQHALCETELGKLRAILQGSGDLRQQAQNIVAADRLQDRAVAKIVGKVTEDK